MVLAARLVMPVVASAFLSTSVTPMIVRVQEISTRNEGWLKSPNKMINSSLFLILKVLAIIVN